MHELLPEVRFPDVFFFFETRFALLRFPDVFFFGTRFALLRFPEPLFFTQRFVPLYVVSTVHVFPSFPVLVVPTE
jgi:hypothetical protein